MSSWKNLVARWGSGAGETDDVRIDASTNTLNTIEYEHHEIHSGSMYAVHLKDLTFAKDGEMGVIFTTPDTTKWLHAVALVQITDKSSFDILEAPTIDVGNYPTNFYVPINRNRNSGNTSAALSVRAAPNANEVSLVLDGDASPVSADGTVIHTEVIGGAKNRASGEGVRSTSEYILKQDTTYYYRITGDNTGTGALGLSIELIWYEHTDKH